MTFSRWRHGAAVGATAALSGGLLMAPPAVAAELPSPILHYTFDTAGAAGASLAEGATVDDLAGTHDGVVGGTGTTLVAGPSGAAGDLAVDLPGGATDSTAGHVVIPPGLVDPATVDLTMSAWMRWDGGQQCAWAFALGQDTNRYLFSTPQCFSGLITAVKNGTEVRATAPAPGAAGRWVHVTTVLDGGTSLTTYVDGVAVATSPTTHTAASAVGTDAYSGYLGRSFWPDPRFAGALDDFLVHDVALSAEQVAALGEPVFSTFATADAGAVDLGDTSAVTGDLALPTSGASGSTITWASSDPAVVSATGDVTRPVAGEPSAVVTLTPTARFGTVSVVGAAVEVTVLPDVDDAGAVEWDAMHVVLPHLDDVRGNVHLPTTGTYGSTLVWSSSNPAVITATGEVVRPAAGGAPVTVDLTVTATRGTETHAHTYVATVAPLPVEEELFGYVMAHFVEDAQGYAEKVYLSLSEGDDALSWDRLNGGEPILSSDQGTTGLRDPYMIRSPEGDRFYMIATDLRVFGGDDAGWGEWSSNGSRSIMVWESTDMINWSDGRLVEVAPETAGMAWAPEVVWDDEAGEYVVFWASNVYAEDDPEHTGSTYSRILYSTTRDFVTFSPAQTYLDTGLATIDTTMIEHDGRWYRFHKENGGGAASRQLYQDVGSGIFADDFEVLATTIGQAQYGAVEGPLVFKDNAAERWYLFVDDYPTPGYRPMVTDDLDSGVWTPAPEFSLPEFTKHGVVVPLRGGEWERLAGVSTTDVADVAVSTDAGVAPVLPGTVVVTLSDGTEQERRVTWDVEPGDYDEAGTVQVVGDVVGTDVDATAAVTVGDEEPADTTAPTVSATVDAEARTVTVTATDDMAGDLTVEYRLGTTGDWMAYTGPVAVGDAAVTVQFRATDAAGNVSTVGSVDVPAVEEPWTPPVFVDVQPGHRFYAEIRWLADNGLSLGTEIGNETAFYPSSPMSRQAMAAFMYRYAGTDWMPAAGTQTFPDVSPEHQFYVQIEWMAELGLSTGYVDGTYGPTNPVSRQAMAAFLHRLAGEPEPAGAASFSDVTAANRFAEAIAWLEEAEIADGYEDGTFGITRPVTRQAMAAFLHRFDALAG